MSFESEFQSVYTRETLGRSSARLGRVNNQWAMSILDL